MTKSIYNLRTAPPDNGVPTFIITKFDHGLEVESSYPVNVQGCMCPQGERGKSCRHQRMLPMFLALSRQDTDYFLDFDTKTWHRPLALEYEVEYHELLLSRLKAKAKAEHLKGQPTPLGVQVIPKADAVTSPSAPSVSPAAPTEVPCVDVGAAPIKRRRV